MIIQGCIPVNTALCNCQLAWHRPKLQLIQADKPKGNFMMLQNESLVVLFEYSFDTVTNSTFQLFKLSDQ